MLRISNKYVIYYKFSAYSDTQFSLNFPQFLLLYMVENEKQIVLRFVFGRILNLTLIET